MTKLLLDGLASQTSSFLAVHLSKKLVSYEQDADGVDLRFADGSSARADILVGADGMGSPTRKTMYKHIAERSAPDDPEKAAAIRLSARPTWTGTYAYRTLLDREQLEAVSPHNVMLTGGFMVRSSPSSLLISTMR